MPTANKPIQKTQESAELAFLVSERVVILEVSLVAARLTRRRTRDDAEFTVNVERGAQAKMETESGRLYVQARLNFSAHDASSSNNAKQIEVDTTYELVYEVRDQANLTQAHYDAFADMNGIFNAWPYFREFLQSSLARMGLRPFTLPVLRVGTASSSSRR